MTDGSSLSDGLFLKFSELLMAKTGIALKEYKKYLVVSRLSPLVGPGKRYASFDDFYQTLITGADPEALQTFVNALTTNFSSFFRDPIHFGVMAQYLKERAPREPSLRFWSAASSTGEEAYSMAITVAHHSALLPRDRRILATDISTKVLTSADRGEYAAEAVTHHVAPEDQTTFFERVEGGRYRVRPQLRSQVDFRQLNLQADFPFQRSFDIVFLRNVMIYFGPEEKAAVVEKVYQCLKPGGLLFVGLSESLAGVPHRFAAYRHSVFMKRGT